MVVKRFLQSSSLHHLIERVSGSLEDLAMYVVWVRGTPSVPWTHVPMDLRMSFVPEWNSQRWDLICEYIAECTKVEPATVRDKFMQLSSLVRLKNESGIIKLHDFNQQSCLIDVVSC